MQVARGGGGGGGRRPTAKALALAMGALPRVCPGIGARLAHVHARRKVWRRPLLVAVRRCGLRAWAPPPPASSVMMRYVCCSAGRLLIMGIMGMMGMCAPSLVPNNGGGGGGGCCVVGASATPH